MPGILRALLLDNLRRELPPETPPLVSDVEEVDGLLDIAALTQLPIPDHTALRYAPFVADDPFAGAPSVFSVMERGDVLVHHPYESFAASVTRFVRDAADDDDVLAIKMTLYRVGNPSPIADALLDAARRGKAVTVFVELKARFDENINVGWARSLEAAGGHVVRGFVGFKNHAKVALVVRRGDDGALRRYVHVGTGNYNARSGEQYTDLSLFTTADDVAADVADLFNDLTGLSEPPQRSSRALLVAPHHLLPGILEQIEREAPMRARRGRRESRRSSMAFPIRMSSAPCTVHRATASRSISSCAASARSVPASPAAPTVFASSPAWVDSSSTLASTASRTAETRSISSAQPTCGRGICGGESSFSCRSTTRNNAVARRDPRALPRRPDGVGLRSDGSYEPARRRRGLAQETDRERTTREMSWVTF